MRDKKMMHRFPKIGASVWVMLKRRLTISILQLPIEQLTARPVRGMCGDDFPTISTVFHETIICHDFTFQAASQHLDLCSSSRGMCAGDYGYIIFVTSDSQLER